MKLKNYEIYEIASSLIKAFSETDETQKLPIKLSYTIRKNIGKIQSIAEQIEKSRIDLIKKYGVEEPDGSYKIRKENEEVANDEFKDLMGIEEEVDVSMIDINSLPDNLELTNLQMDAIMFMLKEE